MDFEEFRRLYYPEAQSRRAEHYEKTVAVSGLLAVSNICRNRCTYCGLRAPNKHISRYRLTLDEIHAALDGIREQGVKRLFLISGEDPKLDVEMIGTVVEEATNMGFRVMLGLGVLSSSDYRKLRAAGAELYALKFETSNKEIFEELKPDISFEERMQAIADIRAAGFELGTGNIVGLPGEEIEDLAADIELMRKFDTAWAPVVPYMPSPATPLGKTQPTGSVEMLLREIALTRILIPDSLITAGQPTQNSKLGFSDPQGAKDALDAGANLLFVDLTPKKRREDFAITPQRILPRLESIDELLAEKELERE